jgi:hypothetical protein
VAKSYPPTATEMGGKDSGELLLALLLILVGGPSSSARNGGTISSTGVLGSRVICHWRKPGHI